MPNSTITSKLINEHLFSDNYHQMEETNTVKQYNSWFPAEHLVLEERTSNFLGLLSITQHS